MTRRGRTPTGNTPHRTIRIPDGIWHTAKTIAADRGETMTDVIERALRGYIRRHSGHGVSSGDTPTDPGATAHEQPQRDVDGSG